MPTAPQVPFRGIQSFRYIDHAIFFARDDETAELEELVAIYRGVLLYGASGDGKTSLINAGLLPAVADRRLRPERIRFQPRPGEEIVVERIVIADDEGTEYLPSLLVPRDDDSSRYVMSVQAFEDRVREAAVDARPLLVLDQFEEVVTLFEEHPDGRRMQGEIAALLTRLLRDTVAVKLLFVFREDYLSHIKDLLGSVPELVDQALRLSPLAVEALPTVIRGPFERFPGHFSHELDRDLADEACSALTERFGAGRFSLSEVETVALRLWQADDPHAALRTRGVQGLLEDYLGESLDALTPEVRAAAVALLAGMVTAAGTRNVISAEDLFDRTRRDEPGLSVALLGTALERLERESRLIRRERRRDISLYEINSEFIVPWISERREETRLMRDRRRAERQRERERRRYLILGSLVGVVVAVVAGLAIWALHQRDDARRQASDATSLALSSTATTLLRTRSDLSLLLAFEAYRESPRVEARSSLLAALTKVRDRGVVAVLRGSGGAVQHLVMTADGRTLASTADDGIRLWDTRTHKQLGAPLTRNGSVRGISFSPDGRVLASSEGGAVRLWDTRSHRQLGHALRGGHGGAFDAVAFSPDGHTLVAVSREGSEGGEGRIFVWDARTRKLVVTLRTYLGEYGSGQIALSPDGHTLAVCTAVLIRLMDLRTRREIGAPLTGHDDIVRAVSFSPDGRKLASASDDGTARLWDVRTHRQIGAALTGHRKPISSVSFTPDGRMLASAGVDGTARLWDVRTQRRVSTLLAGNTTAVYAVVFGADGRTLATSGDDATIRLWDLGAGHATGTGVLVHHSAVSEVTFSANGRMLASASDDFDTGARVTLWDPRSRKRVGAALRDPLNRHINSLAFSPDGDSIASAGDETIALLRVHPRSGDAYGGVLEGHEGPVNGVVYSPDGRKIASAGEDGTIRLWDARTRQQIGAPIIVHQDGVSSVVFSPDGLTLASSAENSPNVRLWDVDTHERVKTLVGPVARGFDQVVFSPDGQQLATAGDGTIDLWDLQSHRRTGKAVSIDGGNTLAFSPDGRTLASDGYGTVRLLDVRTRKRLGSPLVGHRGSVESVAFSPDGRTLASAGEDKTVRLWEGLFWRTSAELRTVVCSVVVSGLSRAEWSEYVVGIPYRNSCAQP